MQIQFIFLYFCILKDSLVYSFTWQCRNSPKMCSNYGTRKETSYRIGYQHTHKAYLCLSYTCIKFPVEARHIFCETYFKYYIHLNWVTLAYLNSQVCNEPKSEFFCFFKFFSNITISLNFASIIRTCNVGTNQNIFFQRSK